MRVIAYIKSVINSKSAESSKRFLAMWTMLLVTAVVIAAIFKHANLTAVLSLLLSFVATLLGIATWQAHKENVASKEAGKEDMLDDTAPMV